MKQGVGYTVTLNIVIIFIVIVFVFISGILIYYKSNKTSNIITDAIEKYEGYNDLAKKEIDSKISSIGYNKSKITCKSQVNTKKIITSSLSNSSISSSLSSSSNRSITCNLAPGGDNGTDGYCIYFCDEGDYYYYKIRTNMIVNIPIINNILNVPIYTNTVMMYDFETNLK